MRIFIPGILTILVLFTFVKTADAQLWLADRESREGPGVKLGKSLVLHFGVGGELGFDSNAIYSHDPVPAGRFRITPYLDIATRPVQRMQTIDDSVGAAPPKLIFRFGLATFYDRYFARDEKKIRDFNSKYNPFGFDSHLNFTLYPERKVSLSGGLTYIKTLEPYESASDAQGKHNIVPMLSMRFMPGGGTLTIEPKYRLDLLVFDDKQVGVNSNRFAHEASVLTSWKILPKTALISNVMFRPTVYFGNLAQNVDSYPLRSWIGAQGLLLEKFGFRALVGYGASFYEYGPDFEGIIGDGALMLYIGHSAHATIGVKRDFVDSFYANYYVMNGGYLSFERIFAGRVQLSVDGSVYKRIYSYSVGYMQSEGGDVIANTTDREDVWITLSLLGEVRASDWLSFHLSLKFWKDVSDFSYLYEPDSDSVSSEAEITYVDFSKLEIFLGVRGHY
jgi:hypothetical protein